MVMGHSLGEYAALIAAGIMPFADALEAAAARGSEMTKVSMGDNGWMAAVMAPLDVIAGDAQGGRRLCGRGEYQQQQPGVIGGASKAVEQAIALFTQKGFQAQRIPVSHAFHTKIVAPASEPLRQVLDRLHIAPPQLPLVANVTGDLYPTTIEGIKDILELQIASPVQWVKGLETLYANGVRTFVEVGPKKALKGFVDDVLGEQTRGGLAVHQPPQDRRAAELQPGAVRPVRGRLWRSTEQADVAERPTTGDRRRRDRSAISSTATVAAAVAVPQIAPAPRAEEIDDDE